MYNYIQIINNYLLLLSNLRRKEYIPTYSCLSLSARFYFMRILFNGALETAPYGFLNLYIEGET